MTLPDVTVEIAFDSGYTTPAVSRAWTDVTDYVEAHSRLNIQRGRPDQFSTVQPSRLTLTLDNKDGRFTPEYAAGAYYPNVKKGRPIRVRATALGNILSANNASMETSIAGWTGGGTNPPSLSQSAAQFFHGSKSLLITWSGLAGSSNRARLNTGSVMTIGQTYTLSAYLRVPAGSPDVILGLENGSHGSAAAMSTKDAWTRVTKTFVAVATSDFIAVTTASPLTAGTCFVDAVQLEARPAASDFTTDSSTTFDLFTGYVDEWPVQWENGSTSYASATISASSRVARLGRSAEFRSILEEEFIYDDPALYFPLGEPEGSTTAGNISPGRSEVLSIVQRGSGGTLTFGQGIGPGTDDLTAPVLTRVDGDNGKYLQTALATPVGGSSHLAVEVEVFVITATSSGTFFTPVITLCRSPGDFTNALSVGIGTSGQGRAHIDLGAPLATASGATVTDGALHHIVAKAVISGGNVTLTVVVDGTATSAGAVALTAFPTYSHLYVGGVPVTYPLFDGTLAHVAVYGQASTAVSNARFLEHFNAGNDGFEGESSGDRIERYARLAGIPSAEISAEAGLSTSIAHLDITGMAPLEAMQAVALTEDGALFDAGDGALTFHGRSHRNGSTSAFTLDCEDGDVETGYQPRLDDQHVVNDMTTSRRDGITARSQNQASIDELGYYRESLQVLTTSDAEVQDRADWAVNRFGTPRVTVPDLMVDLGSCSGSLQAALLAAEIGTRFTVDNLPSQAPASSQEFFVEGITYDIGDDAIRIGFNTSRTEYANVWTLDSSTLSQLDSTTVLAY